MPGRKVVEEAEVKIRPVRHKNVAVPQLSGACRRPRGVVVRGILDDGERRQPTRELHRHVELCSRFHAPVPGPVEAVERELYRAGVEEEYPVAPDPREVSTVLPGAELRICRLEVREQTPEHVLGHLRVAPGVRVRQRVAVRQLEPGPVPLVRKRLCNVAYPVQRLLPRELHYDKREQMAPWVECAPLDPVGLGGVLDEFARNERCYLTQDGVYCPRCF